MQSAFGVDHGEVSKAWTPAGRRRERAARQAQVTAGRQRRAAKLKRVVDVPKKAVNARVSVADVGRGAGQGVTRVGTAASSKPGLVGAALLGGGGYAAYRASQRENLPKRKHREVKM